MSESDAWEVVCDALECKTPKRVPTFCLGADWDFMEQFIAKVGFTYEEFKELKKDKIPFICPGHLALSIKLGIDFAWITSLGQLIWNDEHRELGMMNGGRALIVTRESTFEVPEGRIKHPIPHFWFNGEGYKTKEAIRNYLEKTIKYRKFESKGNKKLMEVCEKKYNLILATGITGPWENLAFCIGLANVAKFWRKDRSFLDEINEFQTDFAVKGMERMMKICKPRVVMIGDDYGFNTGLQMRIEMWRELVKPTLTEHVKIIHDAGAKALIHSCGKIEELFGDLVEIGFDGVESLKPKNNDLVRLKKKYGDKIALLGTIDDSEMLKYSTPQEVKKSVTQSIKDLGPGGFIPGATNFLLDQPVDNVFAMLEAIREFKI